MVLDPMLVAMTQNGRYFRSLLSLVTKSRYQSRRSRSLKVNGPRYEKRLVKKVRLKTRLFCSKDLFEKTLHFDEWSGISNSWKHIKWFSQKLYAHKNFLMPEFSIWNVLMKHLFWIKAEYRTDYPTKFIVAEIYTKKHPLEHI